MLRLLLPHSPALPCTFSGCCCCRQVCLLLPPLLLVVSGSCSIVSLLCCYAATGTHISTGPLRRHNSCCICRSVVPGPRGSLPAAAPPAAGIHNITAAASHCCYCLTAPAPLACAEACCPAAPATSATVTHKAPGCPRQVVGTACCCCRKHF